jgi:hypothetical protein
LRDVMLGTSGWQEEEVEEGVDGGEEQGEGRDARFALSAVEPPPAAGAQPADPASHALGRIVPRKA